MAKRQNLFLAEKRVFIPYGSTFTKISVFFLENPSFGMLTILKIGKGLILLKKWQENSKFLL